MAGHESELLRILKGTDHHPSDQGGGGVLRFQTSQKSGGGGLHDFHEYLDLARVFWALDDERVEAISRSDTAAPTFRELARYIQELKAEMNTTGATGKEAEMAAITKVAVRLAGVPQEELVGALSGLPARQSTGTRRKGWRRIIAGSLWLTPRL